MPPTLPQTIVRRYRVKENYSIAEGSFALVLEAVETINALTPFQAGQWVYLHLFNPDGSQWARAAYSIASTPHNGTQIIELGIKVEGDFTKRALALRAGDEVGVSGPWGVFTLKQDRPRVAMFAGGIGVTPLFCMAHEACAMEVPLDITFFYSFRTPEGAAYLEDLKMLAKKNPRLRFVPLCTGVSPDWTGERGRITADIIARELPDGADDYLLCGSNGFMDGVRAFLDARAVDPKRIRKESFG